MKSEYKNFTELSIYYLELTLYCMFSVISGTAHSQEINSSFYSLMTVG